MSYWYIIYEVAKICKSSRRQPVFKENVPKVNRKVTAICAAAFFWDSFPLDEIEKKSAAHRNKSHDNTA